MQKKLAMGLIAVLLMTGSAWAQAEAPAPAKPAVTASPAPKAKSVKKAKKAKKAKKSQKSSDRKGAPADKKIGAA